MTLRPVVGLAYRRVSETKNGYHSLRVSFGLEPIDPLRFTIEAYGYLYDEAIEGLTASWVGLASTRWAATDWMAWSLSGSLARSPYALSDAQVLSRLEFDVEGGSR